MKFNIPNSVEFVLNTLIKNGHKAYIVGGCVRDLLCGKEPHDFDVTTSALPSQIQSLFEKTVATGIKHGTVTVLVDGTPIEVTTFRTEGAYSDSRHPEKVNFVDDVGQDLSRRDFTVNAMCYNEIDGLIDLFGGVNDIAQKNLRAVGEAEIRFREDALRILRLFRFSSTLGFTIEKSTYNAAIKCSPLLKNISAERIFAELEKAAAGNSVSAVTALLQTGALQNYCLIAADLSAVEKLSHNQNLRLFAFLFLTSTNLQQTLTALKCSNSFKDYCLTLSYFADHEIGDDKISVKKALSLADYSTVYDSLIYYRDILNKDVSSRLKLLDTVIKQKEPYKISHLNVSGNDLKALGLSGKQIGEKLEFLLQEVIKDPSLNERTKLLALI